MVKPPYPASSATKIAKVTVPITVAPGNLRIVPYRLTVVAPWLTKAVNLLRVG
jgi:hypothetical protein